MNGIGFMFFSKSDVVRHKLVKDIVNAYEKYEENQINIVNEINKINKNSSLFYNSELFLLYLILKIFLINQLIRNTFYFDCILYIKF